MEIIIKATNLKLTPAVKRLIEEKIKPLAKFSKILYNKDGEKSKVRAWVEVGKPSLHHRKGKVFYAECQMRLPGKSIRSTAYAKSLELALTEVKDELQREIKAYKERVIAKRERGARVFKKKLKISPAAALKQKGRIREEGI